VPEDENLTIVQAEKIHKNNVENWPDMSSRVVETSVEVTYEYKARKLTKTEKLYRDFDLRQMGVFVPEHA
jgi:small-conductance mechanosensitive channel